MRRGLAPCAAVVVGQALLNLYLTGEVAAAGAIAKLEIYHPYLTAGEKFERWLFYLGYQALRVTQQHFETLPAVGWLVWVFAAIAARSSRNAQARPAPLGVVSHVGDDGRHERPGTLAKRALHHARGRVAPARAPRSASQRFSRLPGKRRAQKLRLAFAGLTLVLCGFFAWQAAPAFRFQVWYFGRAARNIYDQQVTVGKVLRCGPRTAHRSSFCSVMPAPFPT